MVCLKLFVLTETAVLRNHLGFLDFILQTYWKPRHNTVHNWAEPVKTASESQPSSICQFYGQAVHTCLM